MAASHVGRTCTPDCDHPKEMTLTVRNLAGTKDEPWSPPLLDAGAGVVTFYSPPAMETFQFWSLWKQVLDEVAKTFAEETGALDAVLADAKAHDDDPERQLEEVCRWLRAHVRSTAEPSWEELQAPHKERSFWGRHRSIKELMKSGDGSPYEINLVLAAAAQALGFEARVLLVRDRREGVFDYDIIGQLPTDPITAIRRKGGPTWRFYQPASRFALPANVPWYLRGGPGLVAGPGQELTLHVLPEDGVAGDSRWHVDLALDAGGGLAGKVAGAIRGEPARQYRSWLWSEDPARRGELLAGDLSEDEKPRLELATPDLAGSPDSAFVIAGEARYPAIAVAAGGTTTLPLEGLVPWRLHGEFADVRRSAPIFFRYPRHEVVTVDLHVASRGRVPELPAGRQFGNEIGSWSTAWSRLDDGVRLERTVDLKSAELPARRYPLVRQFFDGLDEADREILLVEAP